MIPRRIAGPVLIFSDVVLALAAWGVAITVRAAWGASTIAGVLPTNTIAGILPFAVWVVLRAVVGLYPGTASTRWSNFAARATQRWEPS